MDDLVPPWAYPGRGNYLIRRYDFDELIFEFRWESGLECVFLGRHPDCHLPLPFEEVSRFHACFARDQTGTLYIVDLNSQFGTFVNGVEVQGSGPNRRTKLHPGYCTINIGSPDSPSYFSLLDELILSPRRGTPRAKAKNLTKSRNAEKLDIINTEKFRKECEQFSMSSNETKKRAKTTLLQNTFKPRTRSDREFHNSPDNEEEGNNKRRPCTPTSSPEQVNSDIEKLGEVEEESELKNVMSLDQKKQLLWGSKKSDQEQSSIYWETAQFQTEEERNKFHRLMGMRIAPAPEGATPKRSTAREGVQEEVIQSVEKQFEEGHRREEGSTFGLGL